MLPEMNSQYYEITIKEPHKGEELKIKLHWESDAWDWQTVFKQVMAWVTFMPETYGEIFALTDDEIMSKEEKEQENESVHKDGKSGKV